MRGCFYDKKKKRCGTNDPCNEYDTKKRKCLKKKCAFDKTREEGKRCFTPSADYDPCNAQKRKKMCLKRKCAYDKTREKERRCYTPAAGVALAANALQPEKAA